MDYQRHGLSVGIARIDDKFYLSLKAQGKLTHHDYEIITPMIDSALAEVSAPKVRALIDGTEFEGWELRAAWDDFRLGLKHGKDFEKIAIYGNKDWQKLAATIGQWFISGEVEYFEDELAAINWLNQA